MKMCFGLIAFDQVLKDLKKMKYINYHSRFWLLHQFCQVLGDTVG